jgi:hypothetical protein
MTRYFVAALAAAALVPSAASADPRRYSVETTLAPGERVTMTVGRVPFGQFTYAIRATGNGTRSFGVTQQRNQVRPFPVLNVPSPLATSACATTVTSTLCRGISTPAPVAGSTYTFRLKNKGAAPIRLILTVMWRPLASAG